MRNSITTIFAALLAGNAFAQAKAPASPPVAAVAAAPAVAAASTAGPAAGNADVGKTKLAMCIGCHGIPGYRTAYPDVYHVPKIYGQQQAYIVKALQAYKTGERTHPSMRGIARGLTDADMADLAAYYGGPHK